VEEFLTSLRLADSDWCELELNRNSFSHRWAETEVEFTGSVVFPPGVLKSNLYDW